MALNLPLKKIFTEPSIPKGFDVVVYKESGRYYAKDLKGNIICTDSPTACIQEAINRLTDGGTILIKNGIYIIKQPIIMKPRINIIGSNRSDFNGLQGVILYKSFTGSDPDNDFLIDFDPNVQTDYWNIENIQLRLASGYSGGGIRIRASRNGIVDRVSIIGFNNDGVRIEPGAAGTMTYDNVVQNSFIYGAGNGIVFTAPDNSARYNYINTYPAPPSKSAIYINADSTEITGNHVMSGGRTPLIVINSAKFVRIENNYIDNGLDGVDIYNGKDVTIVGNFFHLFQHAAIYMSGASEVVVKGNIFAYSSQESTGYSDIIMENTTTKVAIIGNIFVPTENRTRSAVREVSGDYNIIMGNIIRTGYATASVETSGINTININNIYN
jgi:hypothetical protein